MESNSLSNIGGGFKELRNMWSSKEETQEKPLGATSIASRPHLEKREEQKKSSKVSMPILKITNDTIHTASKKKEPPTTPNNEKTTIFESVQKLPLIEEKISLPILPPPINFRQQAQSIVALKHTLINMDTNKKNNVLFKDPKTTGIHHWHITRHVFRSGLIFSRARRASDSILPLLMETQKANHHPRTDSMDSTFGQTLFESFIDYVTYDKDNNKDYLAVPTKKKRSTSDTSDCIRRNRLDDSIFQYEMILRHLKNYEQFKTTYPPVPSSTSLLISSKQREQSFNTEPNNSLNEAEEKFLARTSIPKRHTQSLSRNVGRTFTEFIMNDLFLSPSPKSSSKEQQCLNISNASSQTDLAEPIHDIKDQTNDSNKRVPPAELYQTNSMSNEEAKAVLNELDTVLDNSNQESPITPDSETSAIVLTSPVLLRVEEILPMEKPLMQRLFEGKKTAYSPDDLNMESHDYVPEEMMRTYETAKRTCFFDSENLIYTTKMIKISRRGYTQHLRMLCITSERIYNLTKKHSYSKESVFLNYIWGITCTPYKDGFLCIHTKEAQHDRGDWLVVVDHPCEFVTQLFMVMGRNNNDDNFLKFEATKFTNTRRCYGEGYATDCTVEIRLAESFRVKKLEFRTVIIYTS